MQSIRMYFTLIGASAASELAYRRSFLMQVFGNFLIVLAEFVALLALFGRIDHIKGWTMWEVVYIFGIAEVSFFCVQFLFPGLETMSNFVRLGEFDRILLRPVSPLFQICSKEIRVSRVGRGILGIGALITAASHLELDWGLAETGMTLIAILSSSLVYFGLFVINAAACFWTVEGDEAFNAFTYGGVQMSQFPLSIYPPWIRGLFLFLIPIGFVCYFPAVHVLGVKDPLGMPRELAYAAPLIAIVWVALAGLFWRVGVNHYQSTGS